MNIPQTILDKVISLKNKTKNMRDNRFWQIGISVFSILFLLVSCGKMFREKEVDKDKLLGYDYRLFQNTPAWELAKAVWDEDKKKINEIVAKDPNLINYQEPKYGKTLLILTVMNQQMKSFKVLLANKADISIHDNYSGTSALIEACSFEQYNTKFAEILIQNGANVNDVQTDTEDPDKVKTALMKAATTGKLDMVKLLVENGADLNYMNEYKQSALSQSIIQRNYDIIIYLLNQGVDYKLPITYNEEQNKTYYLVDKLRFHMLDLGSSEYKLKMEIVSFLRDKGIEYKDVPIPEYVIEKAQEDYPNSWKEYLEKY
jgi:hypothetical protein